MSDGLSDNPGVCCCGPCMEICDSCRRMLWTTMLQGGKELCAECLALSKGEEVWRPVVTHPTLYEVSSHGRVRTLLRRVKRGCVYQLRKVKLLKQAVGGRAKNYLRVHLMGPARFAYVHHLMAESFIGPRPPGILVLHEDDDGFHNVLRNLRYGDRDENELDRHVARASAGLEPAPF